MQIITSCKVPNCNSTGSLNRHGGRTFKKGLCNKHYQRQWKKKDNRFSVYYHMLNRCRNPNYEKYHLYGGKGIRVCERWQPNNDGFANFCLDMGHRPKGTSIDRIDPNAWYTPENCYWATIHEQNSHLTKTTIQTDNNFIPPKDRFRGVTVSRYRKNKNKIRWYKKPIWCSSLWVGKNHIRLYSNDRETAIMIRLALEVTFLGDVIS